MNKSEAKSKKIGKKPYNPSEIEPKWQSKWEKDGIYHPDLKTAKRPFYNLMMFPYPSAEGMHAGNFFTFTGVDIYGRFKRMQGFDVFEPIGLDGFGIHSENYALKVGSHPVEQAKKSEENFYRQFRLSGNSYDWDRTVETYKPDYYKWTQWLFTELFKAGLAYRKKSPVNFCPSCMTVLADEQVVTKSKIKDQRSKISGDLPLDQRKSAEDIIEEVDVKVCERCETEVEMKDLEQWFFRITEYADRLLNNIQELNWTEKVKIAQKNWIGRKEGIEIRYKVEGLDQEIAVFTTRPDTNFGATFIVLAPEHPFVASLLNSKIKIQKSKLKEINDYVEKAKNKTEIERQAEGKDKTGVFTGFYAINQLTGYKMPIWVSDFVLMGFGTGAVVGVPGHDMRDFEFASKFGLEIIRVVVGKDGDKSEITKTDQVQEKEGTMINSDFLNGIDIHEATEKIMDYIEEKGYGKRQTTYHLRDWLISRQRYWGPPIPMIYCERCKSENKGQVSEMPGWYPVPEDKLPVELPYIEDFKPLGTGGSPLANHPEFYEVACPECGKNARRETDVSDTFLDSAWYFLRYLATDWDDMPFPSVELAKVKSQESKVKSEIENLKLKIENSAQRAAWLPVTMYIGGAEHSVLHLLYSRFITMFLKDQGLIEFEEPFARFYAHGLIIKEGAKMSKSKGNIINPDLYIKKYGADTLRSYLHFLGPFDQTGDFRDSGVDGMHRFITRVWKLISGVVSDGKTQNHAETGRKTTQKSSVVPREVLRSSALRTMHQAIKDITAEMEALRFNTSLAHLMSYYNFLSKQPEITLTEAEVYLKLLAPFAPHMTEELYQSLPRTKNQEPRTQSIHLSAWPQFEEKYLATGTVRIPVQVNGKLRGMLEVSSVDAADKARIEEIARNDEKASVFLEGQNIKQVIYIEGKVINFVISN